MNEERKKLLEDLDKNAIKTISALLTERFLLRCQQMQEEEDLGLTEEENARLESILDTDTEE